MTDVQRWVWTPTGMEPYRPHPLMPDVGGVFVRAEDVAAKAARIAELGKHMIGQSDELGRQDVKIQQLAADRDRWRTWAGEANEALTDLYCMIRQYQEGCKAVGDKESLGHMAFMSDALNKAHATLATYPPDGDSGAGGKG